MGIVVLVVSTTADSPVPPRTTTTVMAAPQPPLPPLPSTTEPPPVTASLPPVHVSSSFDGHASAPVFVFPDALDEETRLRLMKPERGEGSGYPNFEVGRWRVDAGGVPSAEAEVDGVRRSMSKHSVQVTNKHGEQMRVLDVRAVVLERRPAFAGTLLLDTGIEAPDLAPASVDLDQPEGRLVSAQSGRPLLDVEPLVAERGETARVDFTAFTSAHDYLWELRLTVQYGDSEPEELVIRSDGTVDGPPFHTTAWNRDWHYAGGAHELHSGPCCYAG
ncbi:hypothetical protein [Umezawaea sp. NPDC059074]|uniref:hypothetical protein n=1 Tax=Umezawaea sp. NPDC059074 TaxID=3346716 RepID=UPI0036979025